MKGLYKALLYLIYTFEVWIIQNLRWSEKQISNMLLVHPVGLNERGQIQTVH